MSMSLTKAGKFNRRTVGRVLAAGAVVASVGSVFGQMASAAPVSQTSTTSQSTAPTAAGYVATAHLTATVECDTTTPDAWFVQWIVSDSAWSNAVVTGGISGTLVSPNGQLILGENQAGTSASMTVTVDWDATTINGDAVDFPAVTVSKTVTNPCAAAATTTTTIAATTTTAAAATTTTVAAATTTVAAATTAAPVTTAAATTTTRATATTAAAATTTAAAASSGQSLPQTGRPGTMAWLAVGVSLLLLGLTMRRKAVRA